RIRGHYHPSDTVLHFKPKSESRRMQMHPNPAIEYVGKDPGEIALTFDDGPNGSQTLELLEILERHCVKATFFLIGQHVRLRPQREVVLDIYKNGHAIGNHSDTHPNLTDLASGHGIEKVKHELTACSKSIEDVIGSPVELFRAPLGDASEDVLRVAEEMG